MARGSSRTSNFASAEGHPTATVFRFSCPRCAWSGCPASRAASKVTQRFRVWPLPRGRPGPIRILRSPKKRRGRRIARINAAISLGAKPASPSGLRADMYVAITVGRASGEKAASCTSFPPGRNRSGLSGGPLGVQLPRRLAEKVPQESVTSESNNSS